MHSRRRDTAGEIERLREENAALKRENQRLAAEKERLEAEKKRLEERQKDLENRLARLEGSPGVLALSDKTAEAAGVPTSKVYYRRPTDPDEKKPTGGQPGHKGNARRRPEPNAPPVILKLEHCPDCGTKLGAPIDTMTRTITDIPRPELVVYELQTHRYACPGCRKRVHAAAPIPANQHFGPNVAAWVAYHRMLGLSMQKVVASLDESFGLALCEATAYELEAWVAEVFGPKYTELERLVREAGVVNADETQFRVGGANGWLWTFSALLGTLYVVDPSRGQDAPKAVLGGYEGVLVRDAWDPYDAITTADHQLDLLHVNRWLERVEVTHGIEPRLLVKMRPVTFTRAGRPPAELIRFVDGVRRVLRDAILFVDGEPSMRARERAYSKFRRRMQRFLARPWRDPDAVRIAKELRSRLDMLFTFVRTPGVPWHNNDAERAIRQGVLHRKISGGRRTWEGAKRFQTLLSVFETCKKTGENFLDAARELLVPDGYAGPLAASARPQT